MGVERLGGDEVMSVVELGGAEAKGVARWRGAEVKDVEMKYYLHPNIEGQTLGGHKLPFFRILWGF